MKHLLSKIFGNSKKSGNHVQEVAEQQLQENKKVIESLRDYDTGKKDIPTGDVERRLRDLHAAS